MQDFGKFVYLGMQKTASTYVNMFLIECCTLDMIAFKKHVPVRDDYDPTKFHFITIRHPLYLYSSLYRYGKIKKGGLYNKLKNHNMLHCYSDITTFVDFILNDKNAIYLGDGYDCFIAQKIGLMSYRYLRLSLNVKLRTILPQTITREFLSKLDSLFITNLEIKQEELTTGLNILATEIFPQYFNQSKCNAFLNQNEIINPSYEDNDLIEQLDNEVIKKLYMRESILLSRFN